MTSQFSHIKDGLLVYQYDLLPTRYLVGGGGGAPWTCKINKTGENLINFSNSWIDIEACGHKFYILCERKFSY